MCGNGAKIGMGVIVVVIKPIPKDPQVGLAACAVVAAGSATRGTAELRPAAARPISETSASVFALPSKF